MGIYTIFPAKLRKYVILGANILFYTLVNLRNLSSVLFLCTILILTLLGVYFIPKIKNTSVSSIVAVALCASLLLLFYTMRVITNSGYGILNIVYPLGASIYILNAISLITDIKRGDVKKPNNYINFIIYLSFFPVMIAGPLIKYKNFEEFIEKPEVSLKNFSYGSQLFAIGFIKRIAIAAVLYEAYDKIAVSMNGNIDFIHAVVLIILLSLIVYFAFSGYSDMGCGMANMLGIIQKPDFANAFIATEPIEYMSYFFHSMLEWIKDYIVNPFLRLGKGETKIKRLLSGFIICCFLTLWYKTDFFVLLSILPIITIIALNNYCSYKKKDKKRKVIYRILSGIGTSVLMSLFWLNIKLSNPVLSIKYLFGSLNNFSTYTTYYTYFSFTNLKYILVFAIAIVMLACAVQWDFFKLEHISAKIPNFTKVLGVTLLMLTFFVTIYYFLPQYPEYATKPFQLFDI